MLLTLIVFLPLAGAIVTVLLPKSRGNAARWIAAVVTLVDLALVAVMLGGYEFGGGLQFVERFNWVPEAGIQYYLAVDGISVTMLALYYMLTFL